MQQQLVFDRFDTPPDPKAALEPNLEAALANFDEFGKKTEVLSLHTEPSPAQGAREIPVFVNEFWTARQRQAHSLHEVSYRACFKPQLPRFFIERLTSPGHVVYDPFMGRGTTLLEAALLGRIPYGCDVNPLSIRMITPRLSPPTLESIEARLHQLDLGDQFELPQDLLAFYHPETLKGIMALRAHLMRTRADGSATPEDHWITLVALNRLTGHSPGFFSVYTLPPNQAVSVRSQLKINAKRNQTPPPRDIVRLILRKSSQLLADCSRDVRRTLKQVSERSLLLTSAAAETPQIPSESVDLVVTSPPFLDIVDYATDNWLRCWFLGIEANCVKLTVPRKLDQWEAAMTAVFRELRRVLRVGGHVAFEVGEIHGGETLLEHSVVRSALVANLEPRLLMINDQKFTKTANCWGVDNMNRGTNTNRIVVLRKVT